MNWVVLFLSWKFSAHEKLKKLDCSLWCTQEMVEARVEGESANNQEHKSFWHNLEFISELLEANLIVKTSFLFLDGFFQWGFIYAIRW